LIVESYAPGYERLAAYIVSDVDNVLFRGFLLLRAQSLLHKQVELTELQEQLEELNKSDANDPASKWKVHAHINTPGADNNIRKELMDRIDTKLKDYGLCFSTLLRHDFWG
jgi:hypothetical protein